MLIYEATTVNVGTTSLVNGIWEDTIKRNEIRRVWYRSITPRCQRGDGGALPPIRSRIIMYELKDYLNAINFTKENLLDTDDLTWEKKYPPFIINKCLSMHYDSIAAANEMNGYHFLDKKVQFHFLINSIRKKKRFGGKWLSQAKLKNLEYVKEYYGYSNEKAKQALNILKDEQIEFIKEALFKGGRTKR